MSSHCEKRCARRNKLDVHERIHTAIKPYICSICDKEFTRVDNFERHKGIHTGAKLYSEEEFITKYRLKKHTLVSNLSTALTVT